MNRLVWTVIFFTGFLLVTWTGLGGKEASPITWFVLSGVWGAVTGVGYSISKWLTEKQG